jgi:hypothetical protein
MPPAGNPKRTMSISLKGVSDVMPSGKRSIERLSDTASDREDSILLLPDLGRNEGAGWVTPAPPTAKAGGKGPLLNIALRLTGTESGWAGPANAGLSLTKNECAISTEG